MIHSLRTHSCWNKAITTGIRAVLIVTPALIAIGCRTTDERASSSPEPQPTSLAVEEGAYFVEVTGQAGIDFVHSIGDGELSNMVETVGSGAAFLDYDQDGYLDLYVVNSTYLEGVSDGKKPKGTPANRLYRNRGDGDFEDVTDEAGVADPNGYGMGVSVGDYDNDGYPDIYVCNYGSNVLFHNNGNGAFTDVTKKAGVGGNSNTVGAVWLDFDNDGMLDLYVGNYLDYDPDYSYYYSPDGFPGPLAYPGQPDVLYRNQGDGAFEDVTESMGLFKPEGRMMGSSAADYDNDGYVDLYVANDVMGNYLYHNEGGKRFQEMGLGAGVAYSEGGEATSSMAVDFADYNSDGLLDLFVSDIHFSALYRNEGHGLFSDVTIPAGIAAPSGQYDGWGAAFLDYDNDGDPDIFKVNGDLNHLFGQEDQLFENMNTGQFRDVSVEKGSYFVQELVGRGACFGDYDNDGDVDVFIVNLNDRALLLRNESLDRNNWLMMQLVGSASNRDGVGAKVKVIADGREQVAQKKSSSGYLSQNDPRLHFGLGKSEKVDKIEIVWPSGKSHVLENVRAGQIITITEPSETGS
ncbi:MAG: CRTAC1 family protein [bacterium]